MRFCTQRGDYGRIIGSRNMRIHSFWELLKLMLARGGRVIFHNCVIVGFLLPIVLKYWCNKHVPNHNAAMSSEKQIYCSCWVWCLCYVCTIVLRHVLSCSSMFHSLLFVFAPFLIWPSCWQIRRQGLLCTLVYMSTGWLGAILTVSSPYSPCARYSHIYYGFVPLLTLC